MTSFEGACHCGAIRFAVSEAPPWLTSCNCSLCRRIGGLWAHYTADKITLSYDPAAAIRYIQGDRTLATISCAVCGSTTHWESLSGEDNPRMAVNFNMCEPAAISGLRIRRFDGAESWAFLD